MYMTADLKADQTALHKSGLFDSGFIHIILKCIVSYEDPHRTMKGTWLGSKTKQIQSKILFL